MRFSGALLGFGCLLSLAGLLFPLIGPPGTSGRCRANVRFWTLIPGIILLLGAAVAFFRWDWVLMPAYRHGPPGALEQPAPPSLILLGLPVIPIYYGLRLFVPAYILAEHPVAVIVPFSLASSYGWTAVIYLIRRFGRRSQPAAQT